MSTQIQTTIGALVEAEPALAKLATLKLDAKTRYHVVKLARLVSQEVREHFTEPRNEAVKEYGAEREPTESEKVTFGPQKVTEVRPEHKPQFFARVNELAAVPVTIPWGPLTTAMVDSCTDVTAADLLALGPLFDMGEGA